MTTTKLEDVIQLCSGSENVARYLIHPDLFANLDGELAKKIVGEEHARRVLLLAACSSFVLHDDGEQLPHLFVNAESSAGKDYVIRCTLKLLRPESCNKPPYREIGVVFRRTKITPEAFTYWLRDEAKEGFTWRGKVLCLSDVSQKLIDADAVKAMMTEGSSATVVLNQKAVEIEIPGRPLMIFSSHGARPSDEMLNRFDMLTLSEDEGQTRRILERQAAIAAGLEKPAGISEEAEAVFIVLSKQPQAKVRIPFAPQLGKVFPATDVRARRAFSRLMEYVKSSAALHQFQREVDGDGYLLATKQDYLIAADAVRVLSFAGPQARLARSARKAWEALAKFAFGSALVSREFTNSELCAGIPSISMEMWRRYLERFAGLGLVVCREEKPEEGRGRPHQIWTCTTSILDSYNLPDLEDM